MGIEQLNQSANLKQIASDDDRLELNANAVSGYFENNEITPYEGEGSGIDFSSIFSGLRERVSLNLGPRLDGIRDDLGNYIVNDGEETESTSSTSASSSTDATSRTNDDTGSSNVDDVWQAILDGENRLDHFGLTDEQWEGFLQNLRDMGLGWAADHLAEHPEDAPEFLDWLLDPEGFESGWIAEAQAEWLADSETREAVADRVNEHLDEIAEQLGLTKVTLSNGETVYMDADGNYFDVTFDEQTGDVIVVPVDVHVTNTYYGEQVEVVRHSAFLEGERHSVEEFDGILDLTNEELDAFVSIEERVDQKYEEAHIPSEFRDNPPEMTEEQHARLQEDFDSMWLEEDGDYIVASEEYYAFQDKVNNLYDILGYLMMLGQARLDIKRIINELTTEVQLDKDKFDLIEIAQGKKENGTLALRYHYSSMKKYCDSHNNRVLQEKLKEARKEAHDRARHARWRGALNYISEIVTWGASDACDNAEREIEQKLTKGIYREKEAFDRRTAERNGMMIASRKIGANDPFGAAINQTIEEANADDLLTDEPGDGYLDVNQNQENGTTLTNPEGTGLRDRLVLLQSLRQIWYKLGMAKTKLQQAVTEGVTGLELGSDAEGLIMGAVNDAAQFEQLLFSTMVNLVISIRDSHNSANYAAKMQDYYHRMWVAGHWSALFGPLLGWLGKMIADQWAETFYIWDSLDRWERFGAIVSIVFTLMPITNMNEDKKVRFENSDLKIDLDKLEELINKSAEAKSIVGRQIVDSEKALKEVLKRLDFLQWQAIAGLDDPSIIQRDENGISGIDAAQANQLRSSLVKLQNIQRVVYLLMRAKMRLKNTLNKVLNIGSSRIGDPISASEVDQVTETSLLAFELKLSNLKNRVSQNNERRMAKLRRIQALCRSLGAVVGVVVAVVAIVAGLFTGMATLAAAVAAAIAFATAVAGLGAAIGEIIYQAIYGGSDHAPARDFYDPVKAARVAETAANLLNELAHRAEMQIDRINGDAKNSVGDTGIFAGNQWALDPVLFMDVNNALRRISAIERAILSLVEAKKDVKNIVNSSTIGVANQGDRDFVKSIVKAGDKDRKSVV